jgi:hypothetical protein
MKSSQINFYLMPEDAVEVDRYLQKNGLILLAEPMPDSNLLSIDSLQYLQWKDWKIRSVKYIARIEDKDKIKIEFVESQNYYTIDVLNSPVIEIWFPSFTTSEKRKRGRVYYVKTFFDKVSQREISKHPEFLDTAENFFKWIRKNFKNAKLPGYENFLVSERTANWVKESGGELALN